LEARLAVDAGDDVDQTRLAQNPQGLRQLGVGLEKSHGT